MSIRKRNVILLLLLIGHSAIQAQHFQQAYWFRLALRTSWNNHWIYQLEADERRFIRPDRQMQFIAHQRLGRQLNAHWQVGMGTTYSNVRGRNEARWYEDAQFTHSNWGKAGLSHRIRVEQRQFFDPDQFRWRWRYRMQLEYWFRPGWRLRCNDELMWQQQTWDQNRTYAAILYEQHQRWQLEIGLLHQWQHRTSRPDDVTDVIRTTCYLNW